MIYKAPDPEMGKVLEVAILEMMEVAKKHGFFVKLSDDMRGSWIIYPEFPHDWKASKIK